MEPKSLKDFDAVTINSVDHINKNELRAEAIKQVKADHNCGCSFCYGFKKFFNITNEELQ